MRKLAIITCKSKKKDYKCSVAEMYSDSPHYKFQTPFIKEYYDDYKILSLKYGILDLEEEIEPYNITLTKGSMIKKTPTLTSKSLRNWATKTKKQIAQLSFEYDIVDLHLSNSYFHEIQEVLQIPNVRLIKTPHPLQLKANYDKMLTEYLNTGSTNLEIITSYIQWKNAFANELLNKKLVLPWKL